MQQLLICIALGMLAWPCVCREAAGMSSDRLRQMSAKSGGGPARRLAGWLIRQRWWGSYAGAVTSILALIPWGR